MGWRKGGREGGKEEEVKEVVKGEGEKGSEEEIERENGGHTFAECMMRTLGSCTCSLEE